MNKNPIYVPILKWKQSERSTLKSLVDKQKNSIIPIVEIMPDDEGAAPDPGATASGLIDCWCKDGSRIYIDPTPLSPIESRVTFILSMLSLSTELNIAVIPVMNLSDNSTYVKKIAQSLDKDKGACIRIVPADFSLGTIGERIDDFLDIHNLSRKSTDILIDFKDDTDSAHFIRIMTETHKIPEIDKFRLFIVAGGSFPTDLTEFSTDEDNIVHRQEWTNWNILRKNSPIRLPLYSDYVTINPSILPPPSIPGSISLRYTGKHDWYVYRGKKANLHPFGFGQYLVHADNIVKHGGRYFGKDFSLGDNYIFEKAVLLKQYTDDHDNGLPSKVGTGNPTTWRTATIDHHIAVVVDQISSLGA